MASFSFAPELLTHFVSLRRLEEKQRRISTGLAPLDRLLHGGWPRATLNEIAGPRSAGRTSLLYASIRHALSAGETVALIDVGGTLDGGAAARFGGRGLLWVRCAGAQALKAADLILTAGGFGLVAIDIGEHRLSVATAAWIRLRQTAERQGTTVLLASPDRLLGSFAGAAVVLDDHRPQFTVEGPPLLLELSSHLTVVRQPGEGGTSDRSPPRAPLSLLPG